LQVQMGFGELVDHGVGIFQKHCYHTAVGPLVVYTHCSAVHRLAVRPRSPENRRYFAGVVSVAPLGITNVAVTLIGVLPLLIPS
jgi:hypothetical protein